MKAQARDDTIAIWRAGVEAVRPERLVSAEVSVQGSILHLGTLEIDLQKTRRLIVVGAGKASAGLATAFESQILPAIAQACPRLPVLGLVNCPEGTFAPDAHRRIELLAARPAGENIPTPLAVSGSQRILQLVSTCSPEDVVLCLLSGGGSALLTAPIEGIQLQDKQRVARVLAAAGANIEQLNTVRRALSRVKGGGLARACTAGRLVSMILSDVLGDDLHTIASGPTVPAASVSPQAALATLEELKLHDAPELASVRARLNALANSPPPAETAQCQVDHVLLGNNATAVKAAEAQARALGYTCTAHSATTSEGDVESVARQLSAPLLQPNVALPHVWISGGEPTVRLPDQPGRGGRNQQLALHVLHQLRRAGWPQQGRPLCFVSGGTDGEDGPTDAAGAFFDAQVDEAARRNACDPQEFLARADAYTFFQRADGLLVTGPTGTNVCDLRIALVQP